MFLIAPAMEAPLVAHLSEPIKPIKTWVGNASWYGPGFDGKKTADGELFDSESLTAAHPNLPFGSVVRVVNPRNGKYEMVRINDRGPYQEGREIDVSYRVARKIGVDPCRREPGALGAAGGSEQALTLAAGTYLKRGPLNGF